MLGELCPGVIDLECEGVELAFLQWRYTSRDSSVPTNIVTFTSTDEVNTPTMLSENPAFISAYLTSKTETRFANFTSILAINVSQLKEQSIAEIQCGDTVNTAVERVNISVIEELLPEAPVITGINAIYRDSEIEMINVSWQKNVSALITVQKH